MATRCPKCANPGVFAAEEVGEAGQFVRCARCGTAWLARSISDDVYGRSNAVFPVPRRDPLIIEGEVLKAGAKTPPRERPPAMPRIVPPPPPSRPPSNGKLAAFGIALTIIVVIGLAIPIVAAIPGLASLFTAEGSLTIEDVKSASLRRGGVDTILVEGVLANHTRRDMAVPAIHVSLRTDAGGEVYSWEVEPATLKLAAGDSIGFRSALANPVAGAVNVALSLVDRRRGFAVGMR